MSVTIFGEYFSPLPIWMEILYYAVMVIAAAGVCQNLYLAVRASMAPEEPPQGGPSRSETICRHLFSAAKISALGGVALFLPYFLW